MKGLWLLAAVLFVSGGGGGADGRLVAVCGLTWGYSVVVVRWQWAGGSGLLTTMRVTGGRLVPARGSLSSVTAGGGRLVPALSFCGVFGAVAGRRLMASYADGGLCFRGRFVGKGGS